MSWTGTEPQITWAKRIRDLAISRWQRWIDDRLPTWQDDIDAILEDGIHLTDDNEARVLAEARMGVAMAARIIPWLESLFDAEWIIESGIQHTDSYYVDASTTWERLIALGMPSGDEEPTEPSEDAIRRVELDPSDHAAIREVVVDVRRHFPKDISLAFAALVSRRARRSGLLELVGIRRMLDCARQWEGMASADIECQVRLAPTPALVEAQMFEGMGFYGGKPHEIAMAIRGEATATQLRAWLLAQLSYEAPDAGPTALARVPHAEYEELIQAAGPFASAAKRVQGRTLSVRQWRRNQH